MFLLSISQNILAQSNFGIIKDKDGYVNVREQGSTKSNIKGTIKNGEIVEITWADDGYDNWLSVGYDDKATFWGYVHMSRVQTLDKLPKIPFRSAEKNRLVFSNNGIEIEITFKQFDYNKEKQYFSGEYDQFYKGKEVFGIKPTQDNPYVQVFETIKVTTQGKITNVPASEFESFFQVWNQADTYSCYYEKNSDRIFIESPIGDGGESTIVLFVFEKGKYKKTIALIPF